MGVCTLRRAKRFRRYVVAGVARPRGRRGRLRFSDTSWQNTLVRLAELGLSRGSTVVKSGSAGPGCPVILLSGGSRTAVSVELCDLVLVRPL